MSTEIFIARHGLREDFVNKNWRNEVPQSQHHDSPLHEGGLVQAEELGAELAQVELDLILRYYFYASY